MTNPFDDWPWGWCKHCYRLVVIPDDSEGRLPPHRTFLEDCKGAGTLPTKPPKEGNG